MEGVLPAATMETIPESLQEGVRRAGWKDMLPVQAKAIPYLLDRRDAIVQSRTGSGKTGAFLLPMLERLKPKRATTQALILVPTRELAVQVYGEVQKLAEGTGLRTVAVYGGVGYGPQLEAFKEGAHIVVGTPGRVLDHLMKRSLRLDDLEMMVFDEADRMMSMGFYPDMIKVQSYLPNQHNAYMFSATFPPGVWRLAGTFMHDPVSVSFSHDSVHVSETEHICYMAPPMDKDRCLVRIIEVENPVSALIFCNTRQSVHYVATVLQRFGYDADQLTSDLSQVNREKVLGRVLRGNLRFLVATDVAARGIDIPNLSHVFLYDVPEDPESYIHRAGRTGRAGAPGVAISLIAHIEKVAMKNIVKTYKIDMEERPAPTDEDVQMLVGERTTALLEASLRDRDQLQRERMNRYLPLAQSLGESEDERVLLAMLLDEFYQNSLHVPRPEIQSEKKASESRTSSSPKKYGGRGSGKPRSRPRGGRSR